MMLISSDPRRLGRLVAGIDADAPSDDRGRSILDRFEAGELGGLPDVDDPYGSFLAWFREEGHKRGSGLGVFVAERGGLPRDPWRLVMGVLVLELDWEPDNPAERAGSVEIQSALDEAGDALASWGVTRAAGLYVMEELEER